MGMNMENTQDTFSSLVNEVESSFDFQSQIRESSSEQTFLHLVLSPLGYESGYAYPLIVWLHGDGKNERQLVQIMPFISLQNYISVAPRGLSLKEKKWRDIFHRSGQSTNRYMSLYNWLEEPEAIAEAEQRIFDSIRVAQQKYHINPQKIFLAGADQGGTMALRIAASHPDSFAGVISLDGGFPQTNQPLRCWHSIRPLRMAILKNRNNSVYTTKMAAQQLKMFHTAGMSVTIREYPNDKRFTMFSDMNHWFMTGKFPVSKQEPFRTKSASKHQKSEL